MSFLRNIFGPSKEEIWRQFADEIGGDYIDEGFFKTKKVVSKYENWTITLDTFSRSSGKSSTTYTRIRVPYKVEDEFNFKIYKSGLFSNIGKTLGMQDVEIGDPEFDEKFIIKGNDELKIRELFASDRIRELIGQLGNIRLEVKDGKGWFEENLPEGYNELYFETMGVVKDLERLKNLHILFVLILDRLCLLSTITPKDK